MCFKVCLVYSIFFSLRLQRGVASSIRTSRQEGEVRGVFFFFSIPVVFSSIFLFYCSEHHVCFLFLDRRRRGATSSKRRWLSGRNSRRIFIFNPGRFFFFFLFLYKLVKYKKQCVVANSVWMFCQATERRDELEKEVAKREKFEEEAAEVRRQIEARNAENKEFIVQVTNYN